VARSPNDDPGGKAGRRGEPTGYAASAHLGANLGLVGKAEPAGASTAAG
jgi:hypothetical protein